MTREQAEQIVDDLLFDLQGRQDLRQTWGGIDIEVQNEIREKWIGLVQRGGTPASVVVPPAQEIQPGVYCGF